MKTNIITLILGISLFCGPLRVSSQETGFPEETDRQGRAKDLATTLQIARYIDDVNNADEYDRTILMYAAGKGYTQACRILLRRGADPNLQALDGATAIMFASYNGHNRIVKLLLESGADPDIRSVDGFTSLMMAAQNGYTETVRLLLENGANPNLQAFDGYTSLMLAAQNGLIDIVGLLLNSGASPDIQDFGSRTTALIQASVGGYSDIGAKLIDSGADPGLQEKGGITALMTASLYGSLDYVNMLLDRGADINVKANDGSNALFFASMHGHSDVVRTLLERGAKPDINETDGTNAILITAEDKIVETLIRKLSGDTDSARTGKFTAKISRSGDGLEAVELSERKDQDSDFTDIDRTTAFIRAEQSGHIAIVKVMAKSETVFDQGKTVRFTDMMVASMNGYDDIVRMLKDKGAGL